MSVQGEVSHLKEDGDQMSGQTGIRNDPFVKGMLNRLPLSERSEFTDHQLMRLRETFAAGSWKTHPVDLRWTLSFWKKRYYFVFLAGVNKRPLSRNEHELARTGKALLLAGALLFSVLVGLLILYLVKSAAGINLFPGFSLGIWDWFQLNIFN